MKRPSQSAPNQYGCLGHQYGDTKEPLSVPKVARTRQKGMPTLEEKKSQIGKYGTKTSIFGLFVHRASFRLHLAHETKLIFEIFLKYKITNGIVSKNIIRNP